MQSEMTVGEAARRYLGHARIYRAGRTYRSACAVLERFLERTGLADQPIEALTIDAARRYVSVRLEDDGRAGRIVPATVNVDVRTLRAWAAWLVEEGDLEVHPLRRLSEIRVPEPTEPQFLEIDQIEAILEDMAAPRRGRVGPSPVYPVVVAAILTGLRKSELFRLRWSDLDDTRRRLRVAAQDRATGHQSKTWRERWLPFDDRLGQVLGGLRARSSSEYVFPGRDGAPRCSTSDSVNVAIRKAARRSGIPGTVNLRVMRHSFASHLRMAGVDLETVGQLLGHSRPETTRIYQHLQADYLRAEIGRLPILREALDTGHTAGDASGVGGCEGEEEADAVARTTSTIQFRVPNGFVEWLDAIARENVWTRAQAARAVLSLGQRSLEALPARARRAALIEALRECGEV